MSVFPRICRCNSGLSRERSHAVGTDAANLPAHFIVTGSRNPLVHWHASCTSTPIPWPSSARSPRWDVCVVSAPLICQGAMFEKNVLSVQSRVSNLQRSRAGWWWRYAIRKNVCHRLSHPWRVATLADVPPTTHRQALPSLRNCTGPRSWSTRSNVDTRTFGCVAGVYADR